MRYYPMKQTKKRIVSLWILSAMLLGFTACGSAEDEVEYVASDVNKIFLAPTIPEDVRFDDMELRCLGMETLVEGANGTEDAPVGAVSQELYDRNRRCEERFGITITFTNHGTGWGETMPKAIRQSAQSGSNDYDVVFSTASVQVPLINEGLYLPISEYDYWIDLDQVWWNKGYIESVSLNSEAQYALFGNLTYNQIERTCAVFANTTKLNDQHNIQDKDLFELVLSGKWTLDKFTELVNMGYRDLNGNSKKDDGDMFGAVDFGGRSYAAFSAGLEFSTRDDEGYPVITMNNERTVKLVEKLANLFGPQNQNVYIHNDNHGHVQYFGDGKALFLCNRMFLASWNQIREMRDDFVILPYPKFDENIDGYHCVVETLVQWGCVTNTIEDDKLEMVSAAMEQMCYDGYQNVTPIYFENDLKLKYSRGDDVDTQSQILDIIVQGARTDFLFINNVGSITGAMTDSINKGQNNFASIYDSRKAAAEAALETMIEKYEENLY